MAEKLMHNTMFLPLSPEKEKVKHLDIPSGLRSQGWIYALKNPYMPGIFKIGMTVNEPEIRAAQISQGTGIPAPFEVHSAYFSDNPRGHEQEFHQYLSNCRINPGREFFRCTEEEIAEAADAIGLISRSATIEELADSYDVICIEQSEPFSLQELFDDLDISVFGCQYAATKRLVEIGREYLHLVNRGGCSLAFMDGRGIPVVREYIQHREAYIASQEAAGVYGPQKPGGF